MAIEDILHPMLGAYWAAPPWVKESVGRAYTLIPERVRLGRAFYRFRAELAAAEDPEVAQRMARAKLAETLQWAIDTVPAYHGFRGHSIEDPVELLRHLPVVDKLAIKREPLLYLSCQIKESQRLPMVTGGSSRNPLSFYLEKHVTRPKESAFIRHYQERSGMGKRELVLAMRGRPVPGDSGKGALWVYEPIRRQLLLSSTRMDDKHMPFYAEAILKHRPTFIEAFPSMLYPLARWLKKNPLPEWNSSLKGVLLYSENVYGFQETLFREVFKCPVLKHYGQSERVLMAASMPDDPRYFFWPTYGWFELLDADDKPVTQPGQVGHLVGTSFDNQAMPFIRYRTGDLAVLSRTAHRDLAGYPVIERIEGRLQEFLIDRNGRPVSLLVIGAAHLPCLTRIEAMQYRQDRPGVLVLKYVTPEPLLPEEEQQLAQAIANKTHCDVKIYRVDAIERTERGKQLMLVQRLDVAKFLGAEIVDTHEDEQATANAA